LFKIRWTAGILGVLLSLLTTTITAVEASATSDFDNSIQVTTDLTVTCMDSSSNYHSVDVSGFYYDMLYDANSTFASYMDAAKLNGQGWVVNTWVGSGGYKDVSIFVTAYAPGSINFSSIYGVYLTHSMRATVYCTGWSNGQPTLATDFNTSTASRDVALWAGSSGYKVIYMNAPINYPSGYEGAIPPTEAPTASYVAMGDSFSSGEGNPVFEYGTDEDGVNECHRSPDAYPRLLQADSSLSLGATAFVTCSGATTNQVKNGGPANGAWGEDSQVHFLSPDTDVVTITVGGNNIQFSEFANACVYGSCASSSSKYQESWDILTDLTRTDYLPSQLESLFSDMSSELWLNTTVKVYVVGYPYLMTQASWEDRGVGICSDFDEDEATAAEALVLKLDGVISTAVTDFDDSRFVYVDPLATGSPFLGHELCRGGSYFRGTEAGLDDPVYVFHPNVDGQQAYAELIESNMS